MIKNRLNKLTISRKRWLRGVSGDPSYLLTRSIDDNSIKQCCVGIYLSKCGADNKTLYDKLTVYELSDRAAKKLPKWLLNNYNMDKLYKLNDSDSLTEQERESKIKSKFKEYGNVTVNFVD